MRRTIQILSAVFVLQLVLMVVMFSTNKRDMGAFASNEKLLGIELADFDNITIEQTEKPSLQLKKKENQWVLPNKDDFPVAKSKLENSIVKLLSIYKSWPVATSESSAEHFRVADDAFERKLKFSKGDKEVKTLLLGSAPGFKKIHARVSGANEIFQISYGAFEANTDPDAWTDKDFLNQPEETIVRVNFPDSLVLEKKGEQMIVADLAENEETNQEAVKKLMQDLSEIQFTSVLGTENKPEYHQDNSELNYNITMKNGDSVNYTFSKLAESEDQVLKISSHPYFFKVMSSTVSNLQKTKRDTLIKTKDSSTKELPEQSEVGANQQGTLTEQN